MKVFALFLSVLTMVVFMGGCDEGMDMMKPVMEDHTAPEPPEEPTKPEPPKEKPPVDSGMMGEVKKPEEPVTPDPEPPEELPMVTEVTHYANQQLTDELTGTIEAGTTIYTKVVFSEPMEHIVSNGEDARPVINFVINDTVTRYRVKPHGASGEDFVSGDCKPRGKSTIKFVCKYTTQAEDDGVFAIQIGNASANKDGNTLIADYLSEVTLTLIPAEIPEIVEEPDPVEQLPEVEEFDPLAFFIHGDGTSEKMASEWEKPRQEHEDDFVGCVFVPKVKPPRGTARATAQPLPGVVVTIVSGVRSGEQVVTNEHGQYTFSNVEGNELHLRVEKTHFETKEVIVHRSQQTILPGGAVPNHVYDPQKTPGNILIGQEWPKEVRFILEQTLVVHDLLYIEANLGGIAAGLYRSGVVVADSAEIINSFGTLHDGIRFTILTTIAHEIAHAHQAALVAVDGSGNIDDWVNTPEGRAFVRAREKDWEEVGKIDYYDNNPSLSSHVENAAEMCAYYWNNSWDTYESGDLETTAPNRYRWAEEWFVGN